MGRFRRRANAAELRYDRFSTSLKHRLGWIDQIFVYPYRGYGSFERARIRARVLEKEPLIHGKKDPGEEGLWRSLRAFWSRFKSDEMAGVRVRGTFLGQVQEAVSDEDGFILMEFSVDAAAARAGWQPVRFEILETPFDVACQTVSEGEIFLSDQREGFGTISDVDDTIIESHIQHRARRIATMLRKNYRSRTPFPHVEELYQALADAGRRPLFFLSGSGYNLYDFLVRFCEHHAIPKGAFMLRDLGLTRDYFLQRSIIAHKRERITEILEMYPALGFVLIGDSGEQDAEIYASICEEYPARIRAVYVRHVAGAKRKEAIEGLAQKTDVPFLLVQDSRDAVHHARRIGLLAAESAG